MSAEREARVETDGVDEGAHSSHDADALRRTQSETRAVLDHQIQTFNDVDNKAARTFRLDAILLGLVLTAVSFVARADSYDIVLYANVYTVVGLVALIVSFVLAVLTYTTTSIETGLGPSDVERLVEERYSEREWLVLLLRSEAEWMRRNERQQTINGALLTASHAALLGAVLCLSFGVLSVHWSL